MEKAIHAFKEDFGIDRITSSSFGANAVDLELKVLAFNLLGLYQRRGLGWAVLQRTKMLRRRVLALAGQLIRTAGQWVLKLAEGWAGQADLRRMRVHLATLGPEPLAAPNPHRTAQRRSLTRDWHPARHPGFETWLQGRHGGAIPRSPLRTSCGGILVRACVMTVCVNFRDPCEIEAEQRDVFRDVDLAPPPA
jgi:hypothetical protein